MGSIVMLAAALGMMTAPGRALAQRPLGIDVSSYQGSAQNPPTSINWTKVKGAGITYAWAKATEGLTYIDADFASNEANAKAAGVLIGAYHFAHPDTHPGTAGADSEAAQFWSVAGAYIKTNGGAYLMPMLDAEVANPGTQSAVSAWVNEWCQDIVNYGAANGVVVQPVIYTYISWASDYLNSTVTQWPLWMASPNGQNPQTGAPNATSPWSNWELWQYGQGTIAGITGAVDEDVFNGTAAALTNALVIGKATASGGAGATVYWDPGYVNASPGSGGTGTWSTTTSDWWLNGTGDTAWSAGGDYGVFAGTAGTVTLGALVSADGLTFNTPGYTIAGSATLMLNGTTPVISVPPGSPTYINCVIGGSGYKVTGGGVLVLSNPGNYCGNSSSAEFVNGPNTCLVVLTDHDTGNIGVTLNLENGGIYQDNDATSGDQFLLPSCAIALLSGGGIFDNPNASLTMSNYITGAGSLTFTGYTNSSGSPYVLTLTDTGNNYSGGTIVQGPGELKANAAHTLGSTSGPLTVSGGVLDLGGASHTAGTVTISGGTIQNGTLTGSSYAGQGGTVSAILAGSGAMTKTGSGQLTLTGANTYTGKTTVSAGKLQLNADTRLGAAPGSPVANQVTLNNGGIGVGLRVNGNCTFSANRGITVVGNGGSVEATTGVTANYPGIITGAGNFASGGGYTAGYGTNVLSGANNYSGTTTIVAGTLRLGASGTLPYGTPLTIAADNHTGGGAALDLGGFSQTIGPLASSTGIGGTGTDTPTILLTGALTVLQTNINTAFAGQITGAGGSLTKAGSAMLTLSGANTYTGPTTISAGTLEGAVSGSIPGNVNNTGGTLQLDNASAMSSGASLTLAGAPGAGAVNLNFSGAQTVNALYFGATQKAAGTWAASGAMHNNAAFAGGGALNVTTGPASSIAVNLTSGSNPSTYGSSLTFTATVSGNAPGGTVQFIVDGSPVGGPVALAGGSAPLVVSTLTVSGSPHQITAAYSGDDNNNPSTTASGLPQTVTGAATTMALLSSQNPSGPGSNVTFTATLSSGAGTPVGNVVFLANAVPFSTNGLVGGVAAASTASLPAGTNTVAAEYAAQGNYLGSANSLLQVVQSTVVSSQTNAIAGIANHHDGTFTLTFIGTPQAQYYVVSSPDLGAPMSNWTPLAGSTNTVTDPGGLWSYTVTNTAAQQFYRSAAVNPGP